MDNASVITMFTLSGLNYTMEQKITLFFLSLLWYIVILFVNSLIIVIIIMDKDLHEPMYIFLCSLCINGLYGTAGFYPKFLWDLLSSHVISYVQCMLQGFVIHGSSCSDLSILALMAYDRYVAICRPLVYHSVMTKQRISIFVLFSWLLPTYCMLMQYLSLLGYRLCGLHINKLYCVNWVIVQLACSTPRANGIIAYFIILFYFCHAMFIVWSYIYLVKKCLLAKENIGKFMQTCVPHLISVLTFTFAMLLDVLYMRFGSSDISQALKNFISIEFLLIPPVINPLIYGFKLTKIRNRIVGLFSVGERNEKCQDKS